MLTIHELRRDGFEYVIDVSENGRNVQTISVRTKDEDLANRRWWQFQHWLWDGGRLGKDREIRGERADRLWDRIASDRRSAA